MESQGASHQLGLRQWAGTPLSADRMAPAEQAFARAMMELEHGEWRLPNWAEELGISEDEMFIEVDRRLHQPVAA